MSLTDHHISTIMAKFDRVRCVLEFLNFHDRNLYESSSPYENPYRVMEHDVLSNVIRQPFYLDGWDDYRTEMQQELDKIRKARSEQAIANNPICGFCQGRSSSLIYAFDNALDLGFFERENELPRMWLVCVVVCKSCESKGKDMVEAHAQRVTRIV